MNSTPNPRDPAQQDLSVVKSALSGLQFGSVTIIVQDGCIIQVDRTEKRRLQTPSKTNGDSTKK